MTRRVIAALLVLVVIYVVPFLVYALASVLTGIQPPTESSPAAFLLGVLVAKLGASVAFVALFSATREFWGPRWLGYAAIWFAMFVLSEVGDAVSGRSTAFMAALGIASEAIYTPLAAFLAHRLLRAESA